MRDEGKKVILVLEDERPLQEAIKAKLETCGFEVVTTRTECYSSRKAQNIYASWYE